MPLITILTCPADCDTDLQLPAIPEEQDCTTYAQTLSQISDIYIVPDGAPDPITNWATTPTATALAIDNTVTDNSKSKWIVGQGGVAVPEKVTTEYPKLKSKTDERIYSISFTIKNLVAAQYDFLRQLQCGWTGFKFYYGDLADFIYGVSGGLSPEYVDVDFPKGEANTDKNIAILTLRFRANGDPERRTNPLS